MLKIFGVPFSVHVRKTLAAARLKGIAFNNEPVVPFNPPADWRRLSPSGLIPAISHDGFTLADSAAICAYLERLNPSPSLYPADARAFAHALWLEQYAGQVLFRQVVHPLFFQKIIRPHILKQGGPDEAVVEKVLQAEAPAIFDYLEAEAAAGRLFSGSPDIASISVTSNLLNYCYLGHRIDTRRNRKLTDGFHAILRSEPFAALVEAEEPFVSQMGLDRSFLN
ncbi:MAG: glutathione S-transferase family protein [Pseudomonadota bacterium]|nr:glutathione S-transferase family protein [Pseudomonadota bacterium]